MNKLLFVTGMFRSGTTLLGRMLNAHEEICIASDPYLNYFKNFRTDISIAEGYEIQFDLPLGDYYFFSEQQKIYKKIQSLSLNYPFHEEQLELLRQRIRAHGEPYSPLIMKDLDSIHGDTYLELFNSMVELLNKHYGNDDCSCTGFKEVWANEFIPAILKSYENAYAIQIIRDPRAVCASKNVKDDRYPWLFMARQWRKLAGLSWYYSNNNILKNRVITVYYEDLVNNPQETARTLCDFLDIEFSDQMIDPKNYVDGKGNLWVQNSHFVEGRQEFDVNAISRWQTVLTDKEVMHIEYLTAPEMLLHDYKLSHSIDELSESDKTNPPYVPECYLAKWVSALYPNDIESISKELHKEEKRYKLLRKDSALNDIKNIEKCYLEISIFNKVKNLALH